MYVSALDTPHARLLSVVRLISMSTPHAPECTPAAAASHTVRDWEWRVCTPAAATLQQTAHPPPNAPRRRACAATTHVAKRVTTCVLYHVHCAHHVQAFVG
ncbi:hypothetical protein EON67_05810 [archaeon]|nr:MAG: hypothetical protein EON67_05810 [archaeon]